VREVDESASDLAVFGVEPPPGDEDEDHFPIFEENWTIAEMFLRLSSQWVTTGFGDRIGLNYQSVEFMFTLYRTRHRRTVFEGLQVMELAALAALREGK
jgi:hypothetical protein